MNDEIITLEMIDGIYDIQPPVRPALSGFETTLLLLVFIIFIGLIIYFIWKTFYSSKKRAQRKIKKLRSQYSENKITSHDVVYRLCFILRQGLKLSYLGQNTLLPGTLIAKKEDWTAFTKNISTLRYKNKDKSQQDIDTLFKNSLFWLKIWP
ncbi:MAG: hypothetical protein KAI84_19715 [Gammaproteobacteria bacterium]|nr:hypothetical protein [Gammaproteobacteria bacterium]